ncbi:hypothetical protein NYE39_12655 [Janibacter sp. FSL W8-0316]|uniref:Lipoprotein n=1 Tax=Janibacter indicus TaxID=857417 RepID=A0A1L3MDF1_9MICO|nr:hypothetical protein [Janibacter indicus]APH00379.1 hypothetical protein ASJ30_01585 [Janibacter indicus]
MKRHLLTRTPAVALAALLAAGTAGCSVNSPFQTSKTQSISDGVAVELDDVHVNNLALVSGEAGGDATVTGVVENTSSEDLTFTLSAGDAKVEAEVPAHRLVNLSDDDKLTLESLEAGPGDMTEVEISTGGSTTPVSVPVLDPAGYYEDYAPEGWTPTPTETHEESEESGGH